MMLFLFSATVFTSAALLFVVQPLFARMVLPHLGGSPAVWNTVMVFFQAVLLAGYGYAHLVATGLKLRRQLLLHLVVLCAPLLLLPLAVAPGLAPPAQGSPVPWLFALMAGTIALPFFALSTTAPLVQKWFSASGHRRAADPYFLYVASNAGSVLALLSYPVLIEPYFSLKEQSRYWMQGYWLLVLLLGTCVWWSWRKARGEAAPVFPAADLPSSVSREPVGARRRLGWIMLSFIPSSLMLGVTTFISSEVAAVPLMWVVPLSLYLLTFALAFARRQFFSQRLLIKVMPLCVIAVVVLINMQATQPIGPLMGIHLLAFSVAALLCHTKLALSRPPTEHLTEFYLCLCVGGVLGGVFNALLAPLVFSSVAEYPVALVLACFAVGNASREKGRWTKLAGWSLPLLLLVLAATLIRVAQSWAADSAVIFAVIFGVPALICYLFSERAVRFGLGVAALLIAGSFYQGGKGRVIYAERSFFGVHRVTLDPTGTYHLLFHGSTLHGMQSLDPARRHESLTYYHRTGPIGQVLAEYGTRPAFRVAAVGLGAGSIASFALTGQAWTYYEIDPVVAHLARDEHFFTFLRDSAAKVEVRLGDARLTLANEPDAGVDLLILDAYSSDAIPVHLVTREALALYLRKLAPGGIMAFHISNLHLDLEPVFASLAEDAQLACLVRDDTDVKAELAERGKSPSVWLVMARRSEDLARLAKDPRWRSPRAGAAMVWTDDYSSIWDAFRWE